MDIRYQRTPRHSYMIIGGTPREDDYQWKMLQYNHPTQLLPLQHMMMEQMGEFWYEVSGMQTLEQKFTLEAADKEALSSLLQQICRMEEELEQFMLEDTHVSFAPDRIFYQKMKNRYLFSYIPTCELKEDDSLQFLLEWILGHLNHTDPDAAALGYGIYEQCMHNSQAVFQWKQFLNRPEMQAENAGTEFRTDPDLPAGSGYPEDDWIQFTETEQLSEKGLFRHRKKSKEKPEKPEKTKKPKKEKKPEKPKKTKKLKKDGEPETAGKQVYRTDENRSGEKHFQFRKKQTKEFEFPELPEDVQPLVSGTASVPFGTGAGGQATTYLDPRPVMRSWKLIYRGDGLEQDLELTEFPYRIGKETSAVQGVLKAETVSRLHAQITAEETEGGLSGLFLWDYNSTNGTYLNGELIPMNTPMPLAEHDHIVFATEEFVLRRVARMYR